MTLSIRVAILCIGFVTYATAQADETAAPAKYRLYDVGTLGGPGSVFYNFDQANFTPAPLNSRNQLTGSALVNSAGNVGGYVWSDGKLHALEQLPWSKVPEDDGSVVVA